MPDVFAIKNLLVYASLKLNVMVALLFVVMAYRMIGLAKNILV